MNQITPTEATVSILQETRRELQAWHGRNDELVRESVEKTPIREVAEDFVGRNMDIVLHGDLIEVREKLEASEEGRDWIPKELLWQISSAFGQLYPRQQNEAIEEFLRGFYIRASAIGENPSSIHPTSSIQSYRDLEPPFTEIGGRFSEARSSAGELVIRDEFQVEWNLIVIEPESGTQQIDLEVVEAAGRRVA